MCLQGDQGEYIAAKTAWYKGFPQPHEAEAHGLNEATNWLGTMILPLVSIELDCKQVMQRSLALSRTIPRLELFWKYAKLHLKKIKTLI